jgi:hypothetical protein
MGKIVNLTQHKATPEQVAEGVFNVEDSSTLESLLTFTTLPTPKEIVERAEKLARIALSSGAEKAMIGGMPALMGPLEVALQVVGVPPVYAFSVRESREEVKDGKTVKVAVFVHRGLYPGATAYTR